MLLVVTNKSDLACDFLILRLKERNIPFRRLNTEDYGRFFQINISLEEQRSAFEIAFSDGFMLQDRDINAVYFRQPIAPDVSSYVTEADRTFAQREVKELLRSLWRLIDHKKWLNHPKQLWLASNKVEQLTVAQRLGFRIPSTCLSSTVPIIRQFIETHKGHVICKAVKHGFLREGRTVKTATTQRIGPDFVNQICNYAPVPMIFQEEIPKAFDIRVTIIGTNVFATAIHSQDYPETVVDWRLWDVYDFDLRHEAIVLPSSLAERCRQITQHYGLKYAAIDLIQTLQGDFFFLELNPNGQWAWIEQKAGHPIRDALIDCLEL